MRNIDFSEKNLFKMMRSLSFEKKVKIEAKEITDISSFLYPTNMGPIEYDETGVGNGNFSPDNGNTSEKFQAALSNESSNSIVRISAQYNSTYTPTRSGKVVIFPFFEACGLYIIGGPCDGAGFQSSINACIQLHVSSNSSTIYAVPEIRTDQYEYGSLYLSYFELMKDLSQIDPNNFIFSVEEDMAVEIKVVLFIEKTIEGAGTITVDLKDSGFNYSCSDIVVFP